MPWKRNAWGVLVGLIGVVLAGCGNVQNTFGIQRDAPDEFAVVSRAPLSLPPDFNLRPPRPGEIRPQETQVREAARRTLFGADRGAGGPARGDMTGGENALLDLARARKVDPEIRRIVDRESLALADKGRGFADKIIFWQKPAPPGTVVDPGNEARRLRENSALGQPATEGTTPMIRRKKRGWLEGIF